QHRGHITPLNKGDFKLLSLRFRAPPEVLNKPQEINDMIKSLKIISSFIDEFDNNQNKENIKLSLNLIDLHILECQRSPIDLSEGERELGV
uniref:Uncharacterized protein n=1 Tax=Romanomermis culicivorax TaxID=13658 RepID=A0A915KJI7_ROMCU